MVSNYLCSVPQASLRGGREDSSDKLIPKAWPSPMYIISSTETLNVIHLTHEDYQLQARVRVPIPRLTAPLSEAQARGVRERFSIVGRPPPQRI